MPASSRRSASPMAAGARGGRRSRSRPSRPTTAGWNSSLRQLARRWPSRARPAASRSVSSRSSWWSLDVLGPPGEVVERVAVGGQHQRARPRGRRTVSSDAKNAASGSGAGAEPGDVRRDGRQHVVAREQHALGRGRSRQRWSVVWPGVCTATHSRPASVIDLGVVEPAASGVGVRMNRCAATLRSSCILSRTAAAAAGGAVAAPRRRPVPRSDAGASSASSSALVVRASARRSRRGRTRCGSVRGVTTSAPASSREPPGAAEVVGVRVGDDDRVDVACSSEPGAARGGRRAPSTTAGPAGPGRRGRRRARPRGRSSSRGRARAADRELHAQDARRDLGDLVGRRLLLLLLRPVLRSLGHVAEAT